jgi:deoxyribonuclease IV
MIRVGAQVPMAGGALCALEYAVDTGCETMQIFAKSPRRWVGPVRDPRAEATFREACAAAGMGPVFAHASYLINMGSEDDALWERSADALADEAMRAAGLGAAGLVVHLGRRFSDDDCASVERVTACAVRAHEIATGPTARLFLENSAGAGRQFGVSVAEMSQALVSVRAAGIDAALCFDTCHAFAGGIDVRTAQGWDSALAEMESIAGPGAVALIHANDCRGEFGSHKDRHEWVGDGSIGYEGFAAMLRHPGLAGVSVVVEMPGDGPHKDEENVRRLKALRDGGGASAAPGPANA